MSLGVKRCIVHQDGRVSFPGLDYGSAKITLHYRTRTHLVVKISGHGYWQSIGMPQGYAPASFAVYEITGDSRRGRAFLGRVGEEVPIKFIINFEIKKKS